MFIKLISPGSLFESMDSVRSGLSIKLMQVQVYIPFTRALIIIQKGINLQKSMNYSWWKLCEKRLVIWDYKVVFCCQYVPDYIVCPVLIMFQEGRMRGQAFVTFPTVELAQEALVSDLILTWYTCLHSWTIRWIANWSSSLVVECNLSDPKSSFH